MTVRNGTAAAARNRRVQTPRSELVSDEEMDIRIAEIAARAGIGRGKMVVRHIEPIARPNDNVLADQAVLEVLANGNPAAVGFIAQATGLTRPRASAAVRRLADDGRVAFHGTRRQAKGPRQRLWIISGGDTE